MSFPYADLKPYLDSLVPERPDEVKAMEEHAAEVGFPIVGPASGNACYILARLAGARSVYELGSGYGYSTYWFARAVDENGGGTVHHVVWDQGLSDRAKEHLSRLGFPPSGSGAKTEIAYTMGEAVAAFSLETGPFDVVFNDIDKQGYPATVPVVHQRLRQGGLFITDNAIWSGNVLDPNSPDPETRAIRDFTMRLTASPDWDATVLPIREGLLVARKR